MPNGGKKNRDDSDSVSDPSMGEYDSDDSVRVRRPEKKAAGKEDKPKAKASPRRPSPKKKQQHHQRDEQEAGGSRHVDEDEDDEQRGLMEDYDEEDLLNIKVPDAPIPCMAADGGDRLIITDIVVENFKSYYGSRRIGPFHHSFTSIIGPNGSGKSNVIDALLFVFGYKASKIRSKKVSVLIHSSAGKDDLPSCTVKISFQKIIDGENGTYKTVPNSSFSVSRTAFKNNSSEYRMDGVRTTFKDVATRLKAVGIDLIHNRFLILQGEVEQIAMMKPKSVNGTEDGMLEYLEDIIGSSRYKVPIEKLASKLEKLQVERSHQITKVNTAHREKEALDEPVQIQLSFMTCENEVSALQCKQLLYKKYHAEDAAATLEPEHEKNRNELATVSKDLQELTEKLKDKRDAMEKITKKLAQVEADIHKTTNELECLVQSDKKYKNDRDRLNKERKLLQVEAKKEKDKLDEVTRAPIEAKAKLEQLIIQLAEYKEEQNTAQELFDENFPRYNKKTEADRAKKVKLEEEYSGYAARLAEAESKVKLAECALRSLVEEYEKRKAQLEELRRSLANNQQKLEKDKQTRIDVQDHIAKKQDETKAARGEMEEIAVRKDIIERRIKELAPLFNEKQEEAESRRRHNKITDAFESAVKKGKMRGYIGRVGDLGSIDAKFDRAISNNFGGNLDLYLVEDYHTVKEGIQMLKEMKMNTKFVTLDKLQHFWGAIKRLESERSSPARRLFSEIKCDDRYKPAFFHACKSAFVVGNMDQATALQRKLLSEGKRESIVTMDGSMITARGIYVGGGQIKEGKMGTAARVVRQSSAKEDEAAAKKLREAKKEKSELDHELQSIMQRNRELDLVLAQSAQPLYNKINLVKDLDRQIKMMEERIRVQEQQETERKREMEKVKVDDKELDKKNKEIAGLKSARDNVAEESKTFKAKIKEIDKDMAKVYNKLVKPHESTLITVRDQIEQAENDMGKQRAIINGADRNIAKQQLRVNDVNKDVEQKRNKSINLQSDVNMFEENKKEKEKTLKEHNERKDRYEEKQKLLRETTSDMDKEEVTLGKQLKLLNEMMRDRETKIRGLNCAIKEYEKLMAQLTLHNITGLMVDIPEEMRQGSQGSSGHRFKDGESESDEDGETPHGSPRKRTSGATSKKRKSDSPTKKKPRRQIEDDDDDEDEATKREHDEAEDGMEAEGQDAAGENGENEEEEIEDPHVTKLKARRERKQQRLETLMSGNMPEWSRGHIQRADQESIIATMERLNKRIASMKKHLQPHVLEDFKKKVEKLRKEGELLTVIKEKYNAHRDKLDGLKKLRLADFMGGFESISTALRELYQMITLGGDASLELKDVIDPFIEGVQFMVRPPKKSWKQIENLSGGEKTLSSLALVFALHKYRPTPLYVMDEIDAALDFRNVSIIGHYIKDRTKNAQFIIISLRNNMFELADRLVGIYKVHDCTRNVVIDPKKVLEETKNLRDALQRMRIHVEREKQGENRTENRSKPSGAPSTSSQPQ